MNKTYLVLDANYLCHRAKHVFGDLSHDGSATGIIFGLLKDLLTFQERFSTRDMIFCWDSNKSKREDIYPEYKAHRKDKYEGMGKEEIEFENEFRRQMRKLRTKYLPMIGYRNNFIQTGYEGDDITASICQNNLGKFDEAIIIGSDTDLFQLIAHNVSMYNPQSHKLITLQSFYKTYKIMPRQWIKVKAIAGCPTDNIKGIKGVGNKTAVKYILKRLKTSTQAYTAIINGREIIKRNMPLVKLPFKGTKVFELQEDEITKEGYAKVYDMLGMKSLKGKTHGQRKLF